MKIWNEWKHSVFLPEEIVVLYNINKMHVVGDSWLSREAAVFLLFSLHTHLKFVGPKDSEDS